MIIDLKFLGLETQDIENLQISYHSNGSIKEIARKKSPSDHWKIVFNENSHEAQAVLENGSGGSADWETYSNGKAERYDAWSDNSKAKKIDFQLWSKQWAAIIARSNGDS